MGLTWNENKNNQQNRLFINTFRKIYTWSLYNL